MIDQPTPNDIRAAREAAGLTQVEAAELVHLGHAKRWSEYERGAHAIDPARWELFLIKAGRHPWLPPPVAVIVTKCLCPGAEIE